MREIFNFSYRKESNPMHVAEPKKVLPLWEGDTYIEGLKYDTMTSEDKKALTEIFKDYEEKMKPFIKKYFRKYLKENISGKIIREPFNPSANTTSDSH